MGLAGGSVALAITLATAAAWGMPPPQEPWFRLQTPRLCIATNADLETAADIALTLDRFHIVLGRLGGEDKVGALSAHSPTTIILFKDDASFATYKLDAAGAPSGYAGCFKRTHDGNYIGMTADRKGDPYSIILHEYVHWKHSQMYTAMPLWLDEGIAEFYSTFQIENDRIQIGRPVGAHVRLLHGQPLLPLERLLAIDVHAPEYNEGPRQGIFYAEAWALYHAIRMDHPERLSMLDIFLESTQPALQAATALPDTTALQAACHRAFGMDCVEMEKELQAYVQRDKFAYESIPIQDLGIEVPVRVEPMTRADVLYGLGDYLAHVTPWQVAQAERHLREAVQTDPSHARARAALGTLLADRGLIAEAHTQFVEALRLAPDDEEPYFRWGRHIVETYSKGLTSFAAQPESLPDELLHARQLLQHALALNPERAEACLALGMTYVFGAGDVQAGIAALERARNLMPARMDVVYYLVLLYLGAGDLETAEGLTTHVLTRGAEAELLEAARAALERHRDWQDQRRQVEQYNDAVHRFNAGDYAGAKNLLETLQPHITQPDLQEAAQRLLAQAAEAHAQQLAIDKHNRQVDQYNAAIAKAKAHDFAGAIRILEKLVTEVEDPQLSRAVRDALARAKSAAGG